MRVTGLSKHDLFRSFSFKRKRISVRDDTTSMSRSHPPPFFLLLLFLFPQRSSFVFFLLLLLSFLGKVVVVFLAALCPVFSLIFVVVPLSCPVRPTTKEMDHNFVSSPFLYLCRLTSEMDGWEESGQNTQKRERDSPKRAKKKHTEKCCGDGCGRGRLRWRSSSFSPVFFFFFLYLLLSLSLHDGPARVVVGCHITPTHLTGSSSSLPFHSSKLGLNVTPLLLSSIHPSYTYPVKSNQSKSFQPQFFSLFFSICYFRKNFSVGVCFFFSR